MSLEALVSPHHEAFGPDRLDRRDFAQHVDNEIVTTVIIPRAIFQCGVKITATPNRGARCGCQNDDWKGNESAADDCDQR